MQTLQIQFPKFKTYKFKISYLDFQPNATRYGIFPIRFMAKTRDLVFVKVWSESKFAGTPLTSCVLRIHDTASLPLSDNSAGEYVSWSGLDSITNTSGIIKFVQPRSISTPAPGQTLIGNMVSAYQIFVTLNLPAPRIINNLTAGSFFIWLATIKQA